MRDLIVIEDSTISSMLRDNRYVLAFPCLKTAADRIKNLQPGCGRCGRRTSNRTQTSIIQDAKNCIRELSAEGRNKLKSLIGAKKYRIVYKDNAGRIMKVTF